MVVEEQKACLRTLGALRHHGAAGCPRDRIDVLCAVCCVLYVVYSLLTLLASGPAAMAGGPVTVCYR